MALQVRDGQGHKGPLAAHLCKVHSDTCVNLMVIDEDGCCRTETSVRLVQDNEECPQADYCAWMPYQQGQASKAEAMAKKIEQIQEAEKSKAPAA